MANILKNKHGAMEMSVGTIVVIVLMMTVLVLGIFFIQRIFDVGTDAIDTVDTEIQNQMQQLFGRDAEREFVIIPTSRRITLKQGSSDKGFAFSIRNIGQEEAAFSWDIIATDAGNCPGITEEMATGWLIGDTGSTNLGSGAIMEGNLVTLIIPQTAPLCTLEYRINIKRNGVGIGSPNVIVKIE